MIRPEAVQKKRKGRPVEVAHPEAIPGQISTEAQDVTPSNLWHEI
jgi:hypothetical protein